jgi:hypothetical protein
MRQREKKARSLSMHLLAGMQRYGIRKSPEKVAVSEQAIEFLEEWISETVRPRPAAIDTEKHAEILAAKCEADAARAGVPIEEITEEVGDLQDLIVARLEEAAMPNAAASPDASRSTVEASSLPSSDAPPKPRAFAS